MREDSANTDAREDWAARKEMEALFAEEEGLSKKLSAREIVWANVITSTPDGVLVDIGEKREGFIPISEFVVVVPQKPVKMREPKSDGAQKQVGKKSPPLPVRNSETPRAGDRIPVIYVGKRPDGTTLLSHRKAKAEISWGDILKSFKEKSRVSGKVQSLIKGGFLVDISGVMAFMPGSLADLRPVFNGDGMIGKRVQCKIIEVNEADHKIVISRRVVLEEEMAQRRTKIFAGLEPGQIRFGRISKTSTDGLIVDIGGLRGLIRSGDIAWGEISAPLYKRGDKLRVKVLSKSAPEPKEGVSSEGLVYFGIKQMLPNPAEILRKKYAPGIVVSGPVLYVEPSGAVFKVLNVKGSGKDRGPASVAKEKKTQSHSVPVLAFCPTSQFDADSPCKAGDEVSASVVGVDPKTFHLIVSIKRYSDKLDHARVAQYLKAPRPLTLGDILSAEE